MQSVSSIIWTGVAVSISNDDNHYTTGTASSRPYYSYSNNVMEVQMRQYWETLIFAFFGK